jgi:hypothetical protein
LESTSNNFDNFSSNGDDLQIENQIETLKDNLMLTTFNESVKALKSRVKKNNENKKLLKKLKKSNIQTKVLFLRNQTIIFINNTLMHAITLKKI